MGNACSGDHEMMGEWSIKSVYDEPDSKDGDREGWDGTLHILEGTEEHFEGDFTGVLKKFKAKGGKWSAEAYFDMNEEEGSGSFKISGTYEEDTAEAKVTPASKTQDDQVAATWTLTKIGEAHE
eukprot:gnl/MRDRNA2_/MRDRNA2_60100_c0_seq2.p1 gnl/MRDRNA2_/MRDRNA2_60100_c0~~gnl/MRDRNA2_/MRDRNA2_60100_c0_seq2.p1  ORF type:complete len:124 (+),score=35.87 gnl/MRDRNA2_/MRDRNA2_60100_c0_seq2:79-450(+)